MTCNQDNRSDQSKKANRRRLTHGHNRAGNKSPTYQTWDGMNQRCRNPNSRAYKHYGGRGIQVCPEWRSFQKFLDDVGERPSKKHSLDRIDNEGNYEPGNVRWVLRDVQQANRRERSDAVYITVDGVTKHVSEWAERAGVDPEMIRKRVRKGWPPERCVQPSLRKRR